MLFNSYTFIFVFLPAVFAVHAFLRRFPERRWMIGWLVLASLVYYGWWRLDFVLLLVASVLVNFGFGKLLLGGRLSHAGAKAALAAGITLNLAVLAYFKYAIFFTKNANYWFDAGFAVPDIILPIGISFITFQKIAFLVDAYRGQVRNFTFLNFALFVTFFPQLIAGPIVHHSEVMPQFATAMQRDRAADFAVGLSIFCVGLFKKVVVADTCAVYADAGYAALKAGSLDVGSAWIAVLAFSFQLYYDFSGYSDMAVGLARMFGVRFPANFHSPYKATGIVDFWRRWHITLSRFLREYLYIPLGGNRKGPARRYLNLAIVMLLGGLWHGANWTFVIWGGVHGALLALNHAWGQLRIARLPVLNGKIATAAAIGLTFLVVTLAWVPFRADSLSEAGRMMTMLFPLGPDAVSGWESASKFWRSQRYAVLTLAAVAAGTFALPNTNQIFARFEPVINLSAADIRHRFSLAVLDWKAAAVFSAALVLSILHLTKLSPFLYYQF